MTRAFKRGVIGVSLMAGLAAVAVVVVSLREQPVAPRQVELPPADVPAPAATPTPAPDPAPAQPPKVAAGSPPPKVASSDEAQLMHRLRSLKAKGGDPATIAALAQEGNKRFPDSADAPERSSLLIHALAEQGQSSAARGEAEDMVNHYPDSSWVREVERFTGAHRHRNARLNDAGQVELHDP